MSEFNFRGWAAASKLTPATIRSLVENDLAERAALLCVTPDMLKALGLTVGQYALVCKATAQLQAAASAATEIAIASADLKEDQDLTKQPAQVEGTDDLQNSTPEQGTENLRPGRSLILYKNHCLYSMVGGDLDKNNGPTSYSANDDHPRRDSTQIYSANDGNPGGRTFKRKTKFGALHMKNSTEPVHAAQFPNVTTEGSQLGTVTTRSGAPEENNYDDSDPYAVTYSFENDVYLGNTASSGVPQSQGTVKQTKTATDAPDHRLTEAPGSQSSENHPGPSEGARGSAGISNLRRAPNTLRSNAMYDADDRERAADGVGGNTHPKDTLRPNPQHGLRHNPMYGKYPHQQEVNGCSVVRRYRWHLVVVSTILVTSGVIIAGGVFGAQNQDIRTANPTDGFGKATPLPDTERASTTTYTAAISITEDTSKNRITFGGEGTEPGKFGAKLEGKPLGVSPSNEMFIADRGNRRVQVFNMTGGFLRHFSTGDWRPLALCIARSGGVWVLVWPAWRHVEPEDDRPHAHMYSKDGRLLTRFNLDPVRFIPSVIVADTLSDNIMVMWVQCRGHSKDDNCAVVVFRPDGTLVRMFGDIYKPSSLTVDRDGNVYVLESWRHSIYKFDKYGRRLSIFQRRPKGTGYLQMPRDICADGLGHLIVTDGQRKKRVQMFTGYGEYIRTVARNTNQAVVASCSEGRFVVVADYTVTIIRDYSSRQNRTYLL
ncbi:TRIM2 [Branchiostoma lanceolatum]|uniref:TRIM2 protein n=1 Tax=Branchiostoma lanceolatum TaxID=7740 RepID=A0A8J9VGJ8_BRALA|nr:TRIM2 [Branchiostoma lanceolatum]